MRQSTRPARDIAPTLANLTAAHRHSIRSNCAKLSRSPPSPPPPPPPPPSPAPPPRRLTAGSVPEALAAAICA